MSDQARGVEGPSGLGELVVERREGCWLLMLRGEHDMATADTLRTQMEAVFEHGTRVVLDLSQATFIDSSVVHLIADGASRAGKKAGDALAVSAPQDSFARDVLLLCGVQDMVSIYETPEDALAAIASPGA